MIQLSSLVKSYSILNETIDVLKDIDLHIKASEFVAIMGPSGSGKSTLMNIIGCLDHPTSGTYLLNGEEIFEYKENDLAKVRNRSIGFVFQQFQLLPRLNAWKNVELPMIYMGKSKKEREEKVAEALKKVGLAERMNHFPNELSGGQKQRVAIARAIVNQPDIILADEPTGALDTKTSVQVMDLFAALNQAGTTIVLVTHEPEIAEYADRIVLVRDGEIVQQETEGIEG
ncbi:ABC transporter ATP-binding protein [Oceanobacillus iheyensis HTE831]|uniref:ABC transporter ATP-binding protein n=1 Tax=Oceanobacillus iheyensis (strain DSM 14371 / CIP 107618 / JCM 11309 / KCTC 3954 / HTE831) TaxID=221109 RepID=Q8ETU3_OCEIH|nr:ATP-binding cassette domain-containing protein [Oceanobacillus iheyensis]BAC12118.1 ABC transporter ATP-binding protein [Oceanobacillus iheyensis HTE831]